jgi:hypothetical protein
VDGAGVAVNRSPLGDGVSLKGFFTELVAWQIVTLSAFAGPPGAPWSLPWPSFS